MAKNQTESELSFEEYLTVNDFAFRREPHESEQERRPDYVIARHGYEVACEVKEFQERDLISGQILWTDGGDRSVKRKLHKAYGQFHAFNDLPCCLVLWTNPLVEVADPHIMLGVMYGRVAVEVRCDRLSGEVMSTELVFDIGGRMLDTETGDTRNTLISALITLQRFSLGVMRLRKLYRQYKDNVKARPEPDFDVNEYTLGVIVWENVDARILLPKDIFRGDYDQRYGLVERDRVDRTFAGRGVLQYEKDDSGG